MRYEAGMGAAGEVCSMKGGGAGDTQVTPAGRGRWCS